VAAPVWHWARNGVGSLSPGAVSLPSGLHETEAAILWEWEALEAKHQCLSDWRTKLEERTKAASHQFASKRSELERDRKDYKKDLQKVYARELEVARKEKRLAKKEEHLNQREEVVTEL
jgi:succinate dehydrogenase/fumarate reductase flavoprotein subunit